MLLLLLRVTPNCPQAIDLVGSWISCENRAPFQHVSVFVDRLLFNTYERLIAVEVKKSFQATRPDCQSLSSLSNNQSAKQLKRLPPIHSRFQSIRVVKYVYIGATARVDSGRVAMNGFQARQPWIKNAFSAIYEHEFRDGQPSNVIPKTP
jgi:hypothetical protein